MPDDLPDTPSEQPRLLRHPGVVAALITAVLAGVFGLLNTLIETRAPSPKEAPADSAIDITKGPASARLAEMQRALAHRVAGKPDIETRQRAITALVTMSGEQPPETYYAQAIDMLTQYVKDNIEERRAPGEQVEVDARIPAYRPLDIVAAMKGLQVIRRAAGERVRVSLEAVNFRQINLEKLDLEGFYFGHADFTNAILSDCRCRGADFRHARLRGTAVWGTIESRPADFREANFLQTDLSGSKWANVDFSRSNIERAVGHRQVALFADAHGLTDAQQAMFR